MENHVTITFYKGKNSWRLDVCASYVYFETVRFLRFVRPAKLASELRNLSNFDVGGATIGPAPRSIIFRTCDIFARLKFSSSFFPFFLFFFIFKRFFSFPRFFLFIYSFFFLNRTRPSHSNFFFSLFSFNSDHRKINISFSSYVYTSTYSLRR